MEPVRIMHFSDVLCVWAYVSQIRMDELRDTFGDQIVVECRFVSVFGDATAKIDRLWGSRGGATAYSAHVREIVGRFEHVPVHEAVWVRNAPCSSMPAHLVLCAARLLDDARGSGTDAFDRLAWAVRQAFFRDGIDVSSRAALLEIASGAGLVPGDLETLLDDGRAHAALAADLELGRQHGIEASPTLVFNEGRQRLTGNVGYRIIEANVRELIDSPRGQYSWC